MRRDLNFSFLILGVFFLLIGCGPKPRSSESVLDNPEYHFNQGLTQLDQMNLDGADYSFQKAIELVPDYAPAIAGLAIVRAHQNLGTEALDLANVAIDEDKKNGFTWAARGRVRSLLQERDDWQKKVESDFENAVERDQDNDRFLFWWGQAKSWAHDFDGAADLFENVIAHKGEFSARADNNYAQIQVIQRAAPGTQVGLQIALLQEVTRADLAALFIEELRLQEIYERLAPETLGSDFQKPGQLDEDNVIDSKGAVPTDVVGHWARTWIDQSIHLKAIELYPDGSFHPDETVTRGEYAMMLQHILSVIEYDEGLATRYLNEQTRFSDMRAGTAPYNAAALAVDRGLMDASINSQFEPTNTISGADALLVIRKLQNQLRFSF